MTNPTYERLQLLLAFSYFSPICDFSVNNISYYINACGKRRPLNINQLTILRNHHLTFF